jgi:hypothetical protein
MSNDNDIMQHFFGPSSDFFDPKAEENTTDFSHLKPIDNADEIVLIVDRSGSMSSIRDEAQGGINGFIEEQREVGAANITLAQFDNSYDVMYERIPLSEAPEFNLKPRGMTALLDAIGQTMNNYREVKTTGKKIAVVVTDGQENCSREWTRETVGKLIEELKGEGWEFMFLAADMSVVEDATTYGFGTMTSAVVDTSVQGATRGLMDASSKYAAGIRNGKTKLAAVQDMDAVVYATAGVTKSNTVLGDRE